MVSNEGRVRYESLVLFDSISFMELRQTDIEIIVEMNTAIWVIKISQQILSV